MTLNVHVVILTRTNIPVVAALNHRAAIECLKERYPLIEHCDYAVYSLELSLTGDEL
jgi:hypothetical protein